MLTTPRILVSAYERTQTSYNLRRNPTDDIPTLKGPAAGKTVPSWSARPELVVTSTISPISSSNDRLNSSEEHTSSGERYLLSIKANDARHCYDVTLSLENIDVETVSAAYDQQSSTLLLCVNGQAYLVDVEFKTVLLYSAQSDPFAVDWVSDHDTPGELVVCGAGCGLAIVRDGFTAWIMDLPSRTSHADGITFIGELSDPTLLRVTVLDRESVIFSCSSSKIIARYQKIGHFWQTSTCFLSHGPVMESSKPCAHYNDSQGTSIADPQSFSFDCAHHPLGHECLDTSENAQLILVNAQTSHPSDCQYIYLQSESTMKTLDLSAIIQVESGIIFSKDCALLLCLSQSTLEVIRWYYHENRLDLLKQMQMDPSEVSHRLVKTNSKFVMIDTTSMDADGGEYHTVSFVACQ
jgi:hypothetical protein